MRRDVEALSALVDDFFLLARIESGRFDLYPVAVDLTEIADEAVEALAPVAAASGVTLALAATARVRVQGNPTALGRVIRNLIDNAVRHAPSGSEVRVEVSADGRPSVTVVDEGPGFPAGFSAEAFERFTRADASRTRTTGGAGLGLAIAAVWSRRTEAGSGSKDHPAVASRSNSRKRSVADRALIACHVRPITDRRFR